MYLTLLLVIIVETINSKTRHREMTVKVAAGREDCFFIEDVKKDESIEFEFQVTSSSSATGQNDITARIVGPPPNNVNLFEELMKQEGSYEGDAEEEGDFKLCLDN